MKVLYFEYKELYTLQRASFRWIDSPRIHGIIRAVEANYGYD